MPVTRSSLTPLLRLVPCIRRREPGFHKTLTASTGVAMAFMKSQPSALAIETKAVRVARRALFSGTIA